jgi:hypothetical protein
MAQDEPSAPDDAGFGIASYEIGLGILPLGLSTEDDLDVFTEFGGFVTLITRNPDNFMLRLSGSFGSSNVSTPTEYLSEGDVGLTRLEATLLYGDYIYGGVGIGYYMFTHSLGDAATQYYLERYQQAEESFGNSVAYTLRLGVRSEGTLGYYVEGVVSFTNPEVQTTVVDLPTGSSASLTEPLNLTIFHFFHVGIVYRF